MSLSISLAERGLVPTPLIRLGVRQILRARLAEQAARSPEDQARWLDALGSGPVALVPQEANRQHYEVPPAFFERVLGRRLKYSCALWEEGVTDLDAAEEAMLARTVERAGLEDGHRVLELGCGWGSLSLYMAERLPKSRILAVSNSGPQRAFIQARAERLGLRNLEVRTADMNEFQPGDRFDRVVSVEMFEHMRNWVELLRRVRGWLHDDGCMFMHVFVHRRYTYPYEDAGDDDWMARHFFSGGMMPSHTLLDQLPIPFAVAERWWVPGTHYARTSEAWLQRLDTQERKVIALFARDLGAAEARRAFHRWRIFFLACAELFAWEGGESWGVTHQRLSPR